MTSKIIPALDRTEIEVIDDSVVITQTTDGSDYSISFPVIFADEFIRQVVKTISNSKRSSFEAAIDRERSLLVTDAGLRQKNESGDVHGR